MVTLFSFELQTVFGGRTLSITNGVQSEAMLPLAKLLFTTGSRIGGVLIIVYAAIVPGIKLVLLAVGELFRNSPDLRRVQTARICIQSVQFISKWACPDMFAYILLLYLFRDLDERSPLIQIPSHLEVGFSCFSLFCVCSTLATLALELPGEPRDAAGGGPRPLAMKFLGREGAFAVAVAASMVFAGLLALGVAMPCLGLRLQEELLVEPNGPLPKALAPLLERLQLDKQVNADVSLWSCMKALLGWLHRGELNCIFAFAMLSVFMIGLTVADMAVLLVAAALLRTDAVAGSSEREVLDYMAGGAEASVKREPPGRRFLAATRVLKHASMLDVAVMGVIVVACAGAPYHDHGLVLILLPGLWVLAAAEALHYLTHFLVVQALEYEVPFTAPLPSDELEKAPAISS